MPAIHTYPNHYNTHIHTPHTCGTFTPRTPTHSWRTHAAHTPQAHAPAYTAVYLESALQLGRVAPSDVHSELLLIYLAMALEEERGGEAR